MLLSLRHISSPIRPVSLSTSGLGVAGVPAAPAWPAAAAAAARPPPPPAPPPPPWPPPPPKPVGVAGRGVLSHGNPFSSFFHVAPPSVVFQSPLLGPLPLK